jgi:translation initiation factor IF-3
MRPWKQFDRTHKISPEQEYLANSWIRSPQVRVIGEEGEAIGIMDTKSALEMAVSSGLDLITISKDAAPPVVRIYDLSKWAYEQKKFRKEQEKKNRENVVVIKEIQIRPGINDHDLMIKQKQANGFLEENNKIKVVMRFRGREMAFTNRGFELIDRFISGLAEHKLEKSPSLNGNTLLVMISPINKPSKS